MLTVVLLRPHADWLVLLKLHADWLVLLNLHADWLALFINRSKSLCLFSIYKARTVYKHQVYTAWTATGLWGTIN